MAMLKEENRLLNPTDFCLGLPKIYVSSLSSIAIYVYKTLTVEYLATKLCRKFKTTPLLEPVLGDFDHLASSRSMQLWLDQRRRWFILIGIIIIAFVYWYFQR